MKKILGVRWVSDKEMRSIVDERAQQVLGIGYDEFMRRRARGDYRKFDDDVLPGIIELCMLAPQRKLKKGK